MPKKLPVEEYVLRASTRHNSRYRYDLSTFTVVNSPIAIECPEHGWFKQRFIAHIRGLGCPKCAGRGVDWVERFKSVHKDLYDYSRVVYKGHQKKVEIVCREHGPFFQTPDNHYRGRQGCPRCKGTRIRASKQMPVSEFIRRATEVHGGRFIYTQAQFTNVLTGVASILCPLHGPFLQSPVNHLSGKVGCMKCNNMKSAGEEAVHGFVSVFATSSRRNRALIQPKELDIYLPDHQLAIEYCGNHWHSSGSKEEEAEKRHKHVDKYRACAEKGIRLLTIYESEWEDHKLAIKRLIRNAIGKSRGRLMARKCELRKLSNSDARSFYDRYHPQGGSGQGEHYGLFWNDRLVACMRFTFGANDRGKTERAWTLTRYATRVTVAGGASRLFQAFVREYKPTEVKSFSDNRFFDGGMYRALGFNLEEELGPDYMVYHPRLGLRPKSHYQRRLIPKRLEDLGINEKFDPKTDPRSEAEMTYFMGARRLYDCGKKRWSWSIDRGPRS